MTQTLFDTVHALSKSKIRVLWTPLRRKLRMEINETKSTDHPSETLLEKHGFLIYELLTPDDIQGDIIDKAGADLKAFEHVNSCLAVRKS